MIEELQEALAQAIKDGIVVIDEEEEEEKREVPVSASVDELASGTNGK